MAGNKDIPKVRKHVATKIVTGSQATVVVVTMETLGSGRWSWWWMVMVVDRHVGDGGDGHGGGDQGGGWSWWWLVIVVDGDGGRSSCWCWR